MALVRGGWKFVTFGSNITAIQHSTTTFVCEMANFGLGAKIFRAYGSLSFPFPIIQLASSNGLRLNGPLIKLIAFPPMKTTSQMHAQKRNQRTEKPIPLSHGFPPKLEGGKQSRQILPSLHGTLLERLQSINLDHNIYYIRVLKGISANLPNDAKTRRMRIWSIWLLQGPKPNFLFIAQAIYWSPLFYSANCIRL